MSKSRPWPNNAKWARDRTAEELVEIRKHLVYVLTNVSELDRSELIRRVAMALDHSNTGLRHLEGVGAVTVPE